MADAHLEDSKSGITEDERSLRWVITSREVPAPKMEQEELTISYGDTYERIGYAPGREPPAASRPTARDMAYLVRTFCAEHEIEYNRLAEEYVVSCLSRQSLR